ncbi:GNAT family N-acetyltransferase [Virgibacillus siamensis]|uniref:GNAT family N-acetyltransferase n=1 Tax=Virgibacillus siamensis TaxID=480071 RepID=UPI00098785EC|nr:GNAT family N-acetyltransferase [Virgibacillus siamensis]
MVSFKSYQFENCTVQQAVDTDADMVIAVLKGAAEWLESKGIQQWEYLRSGGEDTEIKADILAGATFLVKDSDGQVAATFNLSSKQNEWDIDVWGIRTDRAVYLHRLAVNRNYHRAGIGKKTLAWIMDNIVLPDGYIRLDCVGDNPVLNEYYLEAGFAFAGYTDIDAGKFSKYEIATDSEA